VERLRTEERAHQRLEHAAVRARWPIRPKGAYRGFPGLEGWINITRPSLRTTG
jgi:hypothetical protein